MNLKVSNDGKYLAYLWSEIESPVKVYLINLQTRENIFLHELNKAELTFALDWSKDNKKIVVADNNDLFHIDIESKQVDIITLPEDITPFYLAVGDTNKILLSTRNTQHYEILNVENLFTLEPLSYSIVFESDKSNFHPTVNRDELKSLYFVSQRSGQSQIWRGNQDQIEQISQFKDSSSTIKNLRLSNDQKYLLFVRNKKLQFINVYTKELHFVSEINDKNSQIFEFDLLTRKQSLISSTNGKNLISDKQGNVFYLSENSLKSVDGTYEKKVKIPDVGLVNLAIGKDYFYSTDGISTIYRMSLKSGEVSEVKLPFKSYSFAAADDERFLITKRAFKNTQIQRVIW
ncbi:MULTISPECIES: PD40 domain-containing protein [unclassified Pseudoalteromonas]|uniref:PD40 domain-containing protein n=1 Tax=unclassified Pseudoalteromonas TaxID=194690 RepID=UPI0005A93800|nr:MULTISPECIES: PD40 domain-containing protein [unclassified Pseudoalteromonas]